MKNKQHSKTEQYGKILNVKWKINNTEANVYVHVRVDRLNRNKLPIV